MSKGLGRSDQGDDQHEEEGARQERHGDQAKTLPRGGAVDLRRFVVLRIDRLQASQKEEHEEPAIAPDRDTSATAGSAKAGSASQAGLASMPDASRAALFKRPNLVEKIQRQVSVIATVEVM